jgi:hypothetical protein
MARWCLRLDRALSDDERWNYGCTDEWGTHHQCEGCPHNRYMSGSNGLQSSFSKK